MTNNELKDALINHSAVIWEGGEYTMHGILYRAKKSIIVTAELMDKNNRTLIYANPKNVRLKEDDN